MMNSMRSTFTINWVSAINIDNHFKSKIKGQYTLCFQLYYNPRKQPPPWLTVVSYNPRSYRAHYTMSMSAKSWFSCMVSSIQDVSCQWHTIYGWGALHAGKATYGSCIKIPSTVSQIWAFFLCNWQNYCDLQRHIPIWLKFERLIGKFHNQLWCNLMEL